MQTNAEQTAAVKINAIALNHTGYYMIREEDKPFITAIKTVYFYDPELGVHLCELTPSHELHNLYTYIEYTDAASDDTREELDQRYCFEDCEDFYMHVSDVRRAAKLVPHRECGEYESIEAAREDLQGNCPF